MRRDDPAADRRLDRRTAARDHGEPCRAARDARSSRRRATRSDHAPTTARAIDSSPDDDGEQPVRCTRSACGTRRAGSTSRSTSASPDTRRPSRSLAPRPPHAISRAWSTTVAMARARNGAHQGVRRTMIGGLPARAVARAWRLTWHAGRHGLRRRARAPVVATRIDDVLRSFLGRSPRRGSQRSTRARPSRSTRSAALRRGRQADPAGVLLSGGTAPPAGRMASRSAAAAAALELLHTMALIHDDVMDDAPERRGVDPPCTRGRPAAARAAAAGAGHGPRRDPRRRPRRRARRPAVARRRGFPPEPARGGARAVPPDAARDGAPAQYLDLPRRRASDARRARLPQGRVRTRSRGRC